MFSGPARDRAFYFDTVYIVCKRNLRHPSCMDTARAECRLCHVRKVDRVAEVKHRQTFILNKHCE